MGQAAVDLPDPLEPPPVSAASTDDLLAQLAGEEIDRLLADDDGARTAMPRADAPLPVAPPGEIAPAESESSAGRSQNLSAAPPAPATTEKQLNDIFAQLDAGTLNATEATAPSFVPPPAAAAQDAAGPVAQDLLEDDATRAAERGALGTTELSPTAPALVATAAHAPAEAATDTPLAAADPMYVRVLEALNAPLDACSDETRAALGKVAIVTAANAVAVLIYVLFFRRH